MGEGRIVRRWKGALSKGERGGENSKLRRAERVRREEGGRRINLLNLRLSLSV